MNVVEFTAAYESWLRERIPVVEADLAAKHAELSGTAVRFLRGTYYLWLRRVADLVPELLAAPAVPLVGDLHIENFGTWQDKDGVRRWGVNDLDELSRGGYPLDLLRLATSAALAPDVAVPAERVCHVLLDHWRQAAPGPATELDGAPHLHALVPAGAHGYFDRLRAGPPADPAMLPPAVRAAVEGSVAGGWQPTWHARRAGTGSLGHPRLVAVGQHRRGGWHAREVKLLGPATVTWPPADVGPVADDPLYPAVTSALRGPHPGGRIDGWQLRRLAPDVVRIELSGLAARDAERVLRSMAQAMVDVQGLDAAGFAAARAHEGRRPHGWLAEAVEVMAVDMRAGQRVWRRAAGSGGPEPARHHRRAGGSEQ